MPTVPGASFAHRSRARATARPFSSSSATPPTRRPGQRYTVKRYKSQKVTEGDTWRHEKIALKPVNPDFGPLEFTGAQEGELQVIGELVEILEG